MFINNLCRREQKTISHPDRSSFHVGIRARKSRTTCRAKDGRVMMLVRTDNLPKSKHILTILLYQGSLLCGVSSNESLAPGWKLQSTIPTWISLYGLVISPKKSIWIRSPTLTTLFRYGPMERYSKVVKVARQSIHSLLIVGYQWSTNQGFGWQWYPDDIFQLRRHVLGLRLQCLGWRGE